MDLLNRPKVELHCHLDGSLSLETMKFLLQDSSITLEQLEAPLDCQSLAQYLERFDLPIKGLQTEENLEKAAYSVLCDMAKENVKYAEIRFAPLFHTQHGLSVNQVVESVLKGLKKGKKNFGVESNLLLCAMRHFDEQQNIQTLKTALYYKGAGVVGLDLAGDEAAFSNQRFAGLFEMARKEKMPFVIHSGECGSLENVRIAMEYGAKRIGHGIALEQDKALQKEYAKLGIGVEMCPTSNLQTKAVTDWNTYPFYEFVKEGIKVSINTDNRTVSGTNLTKELELLFGDKADEAMVRKIYENAIDTALCQDEIKQWLWNMK